MCLTQGNRWPRRGLNIVNVFQQRHVCRLPIKYCRLKLCLYCHSLGRRHAYRAHGDIVGIALCVLWNKLNRVMNLTFFFCTGCFRRTTKRRQVGWYCHRWHHYPPLPLPSSCRLWLWKWLVFLHQRERHRPVWLDERLWQHHFGFHRSFCGPYHQFCSRWVSMCWLPSICFTGGLYSNTEVVLGGGGACCCFSWWVGWGMGLLVYFLGCVGGGGGSLGGGLAGVFLGGGWVGGGYLFVSLWEGICLFLFRFDDQGFCSSCKYLKSEWVSADYWYLTTKHDKHGQGSCLCVCVFRSLHVHREQQQQSGRQGSTAERNPEPYHWQLPCLLLQHEWSRQEDLPFLYVSQWGIICVLSGLPCTSLSLLRCWPDCALCCRFDASILAATASAETKHCSACDGSLYLLFTLWCKV